MQGVGIPAASPGSAAPSRQHTAEHAWRSTQGPSGAENSAKSGKYACCFPIHHMRWPSAQVCDAPLPWPWGCRQLAAAGPKRGCWWGGGGAVRGLHATRRPCACHGHPLTNTSKHTPGFCSSSTGLSNHCVPGSASPSAFTSLRHRVMLVFRENHAVRSRGPGVMRCPSKAVGGAVLRHVGTGCGYGCSAMLTPPPRLRHGRAVLRLGCLRKRGHGRGRGGGSTTTHHHVLGRL